MSECEGHGPPSRPPTKSSLVLLNSPPFRGSVENTYDPVGPKFKVCSRGFFAILKFFFVVNMSRWLFLQCFDLSSL
jgi:hypothetical protein